MNPKARTALFGQELNDQSYAICKSDMIVKGQDASNIQLGDTLADDKFAGKTFDYCMSNPPYGVDWKASEKAVKDERAATGAAGRFGAGLPKISDGQMLFLSHLAHKMRPAKDGGGRAGIVLNGSPLFNGAAESGESEIRRYLLENDLVDAIVALPTSMFYNTGIATYIWILDNDKPSERRGTVQLIDATSEAFFTKMRRNLGDKSREIDEAARTRVVQIYADHHDQQPDNTEYSKVFPTRAFGYYTITVERPLVDDAGKVVTDRKGHPKADSKLRDRENVPFDLDPSVAQQEMIDAYFEREVKPHRGDAWVDRSKTKVGYKIPFTRHFYKYIPPRPLDEIDADLNELVAEILELLQAVEA
jgi:type I restriction enzyme M protein